jgi:hypothetical protein
MRCFPVPTELCSAGTRGEVIRNGVPGGKRAAARGASWGRGWREGLPEAATLPDQRTFIDSVDLPGKERGAARSPSPCPWERQTYPEQMKHQVGSADPQPRPQRLKSPQQLHAVRLRGHGGHELCCVVAGPSFTPLSPCHLVTLSPCHLVTLSPLHPFTPSPLHKTGRPGSRRAPGTSCRCRIRPPYIHSAHQGTAHERSCPHDRGSGIACLLLSGRRGGRVRTRGGSSRCAAGRPRRARPPPAPARRRRRRSSAR